jgi:deoxyribodipyrimidine photo-lyase
MRRDLRLHDNATLSAALKAGAPVQPVFVFDTDVLARFTNKKDRRLTFLMVTLQHLHAALQQRGGGLLVVHGSATQLIPQLAKLLGSPAVFAGEDHEPATRERDVKAAAILKEQGSELVLTADQFLLHPGDKSLLSKSGTAFKVFTPFKRNWQKVLPRDAFAEYEVQGNGCYTDYAHTTGVMRQAGISFLNLSDKLANLLGQIGYEQADISAWDPARAHQCLKNFASQGMKNYRERRNLPGDEGGTSRLSPYLRFGLLSSRECARVAVEVEQGIDGSWMNELIWREFYMMILFHFPETATQEFIPKYRGLKWRNDEQEFQRWCEGKTGFPIIDAAMRQLLEIGWMHNRMRMVVASFLTKNLLIDWRWGEEYFAQHLMDYDLASNVGGWQWSASTGTDAQPYFRVFNPVSQGQTYDPESAYIRRYVPEVANLNDKEIHEPWNSSSPPAGYPATMVDLKQTRAEAIAQFKRLG